MPTCLYGLIATPDVPRLPALQGIDGTSVRAVVAGDLAAVVSDVARPPDRSRLDDVRAHDALLAGVVHAGITAVASRFGQTFPSDTAVRDAVNESGDRVTALLRDCRGCVEMRVLLPQRLAQGLTVAEPEASARSPGTAYLERARATMRGPRITLLPMLSGLARAERAELLPQERGAALAHLVDLANVSAYRAAIQANAALAGATVVGPVALYSFSGPADD